MTDEVQRCGFIAVVGRPNVGKSTLVNRLVGGKVSIVSPKAQTTRHVIRGVLTRGAAQYVFVDTPGFQTRHGSALNRLMNRSVTTTLQDVDLVLCVVEASGITAEDREVFRLLPDARPTILLLNKIDRLADRKVLLPRIAQAAEERGFAEIIPISAAKGRGCEDLLRTVSDYLPEAGHLFEADAITDRSERFLAAEFIREKLFNRLGDELPYGLTVEVERFEVEGSLRRIAAAVIVDRESHKPIIIGKGGEALKAVATAAREEMERLFDGKVFLEVWVKVRGGWADDERALRSLGYE